ncbi:MAG: hypothetical protein HYW90_01605 [Candidatus Sungbacteria bacterium]|nr:hypothetical protein [Candidatus Sungbacteria bacterium]
MSLRWNIFSSSQKTVKHRLFIDVGSSAIRSLLVESGPKGHLGIKKRVHYLPVMAERSRFLKKVSGQFHEIIFRYIKSLGSIPEKIVISASPPLAPVAVEVIKKERHDKNKPVSVKEIEGLLAEKITRTPSAAWHPPQLTRLTVDGYDISLEDTENITGSVIELSAAYPTFEPDFIEAFSALNKTWGGLTLEIHSTPITVAMATIKKLAERNFAIIKIGGTATTVIAVASGTILWVESFPFGGDDVTRELVNQLKIEIGEAEDIKRRFGKFVLPQALSEKAEEIFKRHAEKLAGTVVSPFLKRQNAFPPTVFLYGGGAKDSAVQKTLSDPHWFENTTFAEKLRVEVLAGERFTDGVLFNSPLQGPDYVELAASVFKTLNT